MLRFLPRVAPGVTRRTSQNLRVSCQLILRENRVNLLSKATTSPQLALLGFETDEGLLAKATSDAQSKIRDDTDLGGIANESQLRDTLVSHAAMELFIQTAATIFVRSMMRILSPLSTPPCLSGLPDTISACHKAPPE